MGSTTLLARANLSTRDVLERATPVSRATSVPSIVTVEHGRDGDVVFPHDDLGKLLDLVSFFEGHTEPGPLLWPDGEQIPLPAQIYRVRRQAVDAMRQAEDASSPARACS